MEWFLANWATATPLIGSAVAWAVSSASNAITNRRERNQKEMQRLGEIMVILYNNDFQHGHWAQIAAVNEIRTLKACRPEALKLARLAREHWTNDGSKMILSEIDRLISDLE